MPYKRQGLHLLIETIVQGLYNFGLPYLCLSAYLEFSTFGGCDLWRNEHGSSQESIAALARSRPSYFSSEAIESRVQLANCSNLTASRHSMANSSGSHRST